MEFWRKTYHCGSNLSEVIWQISHNLSLFIWYFHSNSPPHTILMSISQLLSGTGAQSHAPSHFSFYHHLKVLPKPLLIHIKIIAKVPSKVHFHKTSSNLYQKATQGLECGLVRISLGKSWSLPLKWGTKSKCTIKKLLPSSPVHPLYLPSITVRECS